MDILLLEDDKEKALEVTNFLKNSNLDINVFHTSTFIGFIRALERQDYHLVIVDLLVPRFSENEEAIDVALEIIDACRDKDCRNWKIPVIALTAYDSASQTNYKNLNKWDITVISYDSSKDWKIPLIDKLLICRPKTIFDFVIICALTKEVRGFEEAGYTLGNSTVVGNLECRGIKIGELNGVIVTAPRMGLVSCAITTTQAIQEFSPKLVCMSGICAGISGKARIYDVVIAESCHQHDFGKWSVGGYEPEIYSVPIHHDLRQKLKTATETPEFTDQLLAGVKYIGSELPDECQQLLSRVFLAPASSGSAVISDTEMVRLISEQQRKNTIFEMESFAVYESSRLCSSDIRFFSAKAVVDDGGPTKGDRFHRVACILAAKVTYECIRLASI